MARRLDASCQGKKVFRSFTDAERAAKLGSFRHDLKMNPYLCRFCHKFHVGNARPAVKRPRLEPMVDEETS